MKHIIRLLLGSLAVASLLLAACTPKAQSAVSEKPSKIVKIEGSEFSQVVLTQKASERLGIELDKVREEVVSRARTVAGEIIDPLGLKKPVTLPPGKALVKVFVNESDLEEIDRNESAQINPLDDEDGNGFTAEMVDDVEDDDKNDPEGTALYYFVDNSANKLEVGQRVLVDLTLNGSGLLQKVVPYQSVIYGIKGETWVYTNPEPLTFVRKPIAIDFIDEDMVVLSDGPATGTAVVTVGVAELFGAETGVSK
ncbi:MAG TPA: hypothetical protein VGK00_12815 [Anaerolineales bacterium]|jgi:hypothetical protein